MAWNELLTVNEITGNSSFVEPLCPAIFFTQSGWLSACAGLLHAFSLDTLWIAYINFDPFCLLLVSVVLAFEASTVWVTSRGIETLSACKRDQTFSVKWITLPPLRLCGIQSYRIAYAVMGTHLRPLGPSISNHKIAQTTWWAAVGLVWQLQTAFQYIGKCTGIIISCFNWLFHITCTALDSDTVSAYVECWWWHCGLCNLSV